MGERATGRDGVRAEKAVCTELLRYLFPIPFPRRKLWFSFLSSPVSCWLLLLAISQLLPPPPLSPVRPRYTIRGRQMAAIRRRAKRTRGEATWGWAVGSSQKRFSGGWRSAEEGGGRKSRGRNKSAKRGRGGEMGAPHNLPNFLPVKRGSIARAHPPPTRALSVSRVAVRGFIAGGGENERSNVQIRTFMLPSPGRDCLRE